MKHPHYPLIVTGATLAGTLVATHMARLGIRVALLHRLPTAPSSFKYVEPVFSWPFEKVGVLEPKWAFEWSLGEITALHQLQRYQSCHGLLLDYDCMVKDMLQDFRQLGGNVLTYDGQLSIDKTKQILDYGSTPLSWEMAVLSEWESSNVTTETLHVIRACLQGISTVPGVMEQIEMEEGWIWMMPSAKGCLQLRYIQKDIKNICANFACLLQHRFPARSFEWAQLHPRAYASHPQHTLYNPPIIRIGQAANFFMGKWRLHVEMEYLLARYCAQQLAHYFLDKNDVHLKRLNDYASRFHSFWEREGKV